MTKVIRCAPMPKNDEDKPELTEEQKQERFNQLFSSSHERFDSKADMAREHNIVYPTQPEVHR